MRDRLGRITAMTDAAGVHTYSHKLTGPMLSDAITGSGPLAGFSLSHTPDNLDRPAAASLTKSSSTVHATSYGYDTAGRLGRISHNGRSAKYNYHPTRQTLVLTTLIGTTGQTNLQHERIHDNAGRLLTTISHRNSNGNPANYQPAHLSKYTLNALDQRTAASELEDRSWSYGYNSTGEVTKAAKTITSSGASLEGRNFRYAFDGIGNRTSTQTGGDAAAANLRTQNYTPNAVNQYTSITHPGFLEIYGKAPTAQAVTVNGLATTRQGRDFRKELSFANTTQLWQNITTNSGSVSSSQHHIPAASTAPTYDLDGNQISDGQWTYTWDGENRLTSATRTAAAITAGAPYRAISYSYDSQSRKISRSVSTALNSPPSTLIFLYDGWNCIAEYTGTTLHKTYLWGADLSGSMQGAGGVGGLLSIHDVATSTTHYPCYDGNGNIRKLLHATTLVTTANYDYSPFGELTRATGSYAASNTYRFSTKPQDVDTGLIYFNYRPYDTKTGRWLARDPIAEEGGMNLYGFIYNDGINKFDILGLSPPTSAAEGLSKLAGLEALFKALCKKCDCESKPEAQKECEAEAIRLAANVKSVWLANYGRGNNAGPSNCGGYLCYEWTETWVIAARKLSLKRWTFIGRGREQSQESAGEYIPYIHFWAEFRAYGSNEAKCTIQIDDGFMNGNMVHEDKSLPGKGWLPKDIRPPSKDEPIRKNPPNVDMIDQFKKL